MCWDVAAISAPFSFSAHHHLLRPPPVTRPTMACVEVADLINQALGADANARRGLGKWVWARGFETWLMGQARTSDNWEAQRCGKRRIVVTFVGAPPLIVAMMWWVRLTPSMLFPSDYPSSLEANYCTGLPRESERKEWSHTRRPYRTTLTVES
jgi:hypothetical protein